MTQSFSTSLRVLLVDDHPLVLAGVRALLVPDAGIDVVAGLTSGAEALHYLQQHACPDVAFVDVHMPYMSGLELMRRMQQAFPAVRVLALSMACDLASVQEVLAAGAVGYLLKNTLGPELGAAVRRVAAGHTHFSPEVAALLLDQRPPAAAEPTLTPREIEVLHLIAREQSNQHIADQLNISERTVETHRKNIFTKTGCKSAVGLIKYALRQNLISL